MSYYMGITIKLVSILIGLIFIIKLIRLSKDKQKMKKLEENLTTPLARFRMIVFFAPALLLAATIAMLIGNYSDSLMDNSELGQERAKDKKSGLQEIEQKLSCSPAAALSPFSKCEK